MTTYRTEAWAEMAASLSLEYVSTPRAFNLAPIFARTYTNVGAGNWQRTVTDDTYWLVVRSFAYLRITAAWIALDRTRWSLSYSTGANTVNLMTGKIKLRGREMPETQTDKKLQPLGWVRGHELSYPTYPYTRYAVHYVPDTHAEHQALQNIIPTLLHSTPDTRDHTITDLRRAEQERRTRSQRP